MKTFETNCVIVKEMTEVERRSYFEKFGESYWMDIENIICIPLREMSGDQISKLEMFFATGNLSKAQYLVIEFDNQRLNAPIPDPPVKCPDCGLMNDDPNCCINDEELNK